MLMVHNGLQVDQKYPQMTLDYLPWQKHFVKLYWDARLCASGFYFIECKMSLEHETTDESHLLLEDYVEQSMNNQSKS